MQLQLALLSRRCVTNITFRSNFLLFVTNNSFLNILFDHNDTIVQVPHYFHSDLCQALWPTGKNVMTFHLAMAHRLKATGLTL